MPGTRRPSVVPVRDGLASRWLASMSLVAVLAAPGCAGRIAPTGPAARPDLFSATVPLRGRPFDVHLSAPASPVDPDVLVLYGSGDGGWFGAAVDMFRDIAATGRFTVGISARAFLRVEESGGGSTTPGQVAEDYQAIIQGAERRLGLAPTTRVVLTGWSRGAAFAVLAGEDRRLQSTLAGLVLIGLPEEEDLRVRSDADRGPGAVGGRADTHRIRFDAYDALPRLDRFRCALIQSTGDDYLPASEARGHFGPDTATRRFYSVTADNHRFSGGRPAFNAALRDALAWVSASTAPAGAMQEPRR
ncbi:MAG: AcvB/VirJ family lysyl-phosphatidylglycerol hydrolase [Vicinamibacterales bacterium]